jgi:protein tyrosine/serine phosphatase
MIISKELFRCPDCWGNVETGLPRSVACLSNHLSALLPLLVFLLALGRCEAGERGQPAQDGILNFGKVDEQVYRGAQPDAEAIKTLKKLGVKLIVNLRLPGDGWKEEASEALANGILYTNFPMSGVGRPNDEQVRQVLALFENLSAPVFIHCQHGCDRTGTVIACYRIQHHGWSAELALREAERYGISKFEYLMRRYVLGFRPAPKPDLGQANSN